MLKSIIRAAVIGAGLALGAVGAYGQTTASPHYLVLNNITLPDGTTVCDVTIRKTYSDAIRRHTEGTREDLCVAKVNLTVAGAEQLPIELGDILQGIYPATDPTGQPIEFNVYLPQVSR